MPNRLNAFTGKQPKVQAVKERDVHMPAVHTVWVVEGLRSLCRTCLHLLHPERWRRVPSVHLAQRPCRSPAALRLETYLLCIDLPITAASIHHAHAKLAKLALRRGVGPPSEPGNERDKASGGVEGTPDSVRVSVPPVLLQPQGDGFGAAEDEIRSQHD